MNSIWNDPRVTKQILESSKRGIDVIAVGYKDSDYNAAKIEKLTCKVELAEIDNDYYFNGRHNIAKSIKREVEKILKVRNIIVNSKPDVIHANDLTGLIPALLAKIKTGCTLVYDNHEISTENNNVSGSYFKKFLYKVIEKYAITKCDLVVSVSNSAADYLSKLYKIPKPLVVTNCSFRNNIDFDSIAKAEVFEVLTHGKYYEGRGYDIFVKAASLMKSDSLTGINWVLRGYGPMEKELKDFCSTEKLGNVIFAPPVDVRDLISSAATSHVGVAITEKICLNFVHSVSNKLFEYCSAGLPVIMSDIPEHRYLNEIYDFGILLPNDSPETLLETVLLLKANVALYNKLKENALKMSKELCWENEYGKLIDAYYQLLNRNNTVC